MCTFIGYRCNVAFVIFAKVHFQWYKLSVCNPQMTFSYINVGGLILIYDSQLNPLATGLITVRLLVVSDSRLRALFSRHGGPALLLSMATATSGILRQEVTNTLQTLSKGRHCLMIGSFLCNIS